MASRGQIAVPTQLKGGHVFQIKLCGSCNLFLDCVDAEHVIENALSIYPSNI